MNKILLYLTFMLLMSCNSTTSDKKAQDKMIPDDTIQQEVAVPEVALDPIWKYTFNRQNDKFELNQLRKVDNDTLTGQALEKIINDAYPEVRVKYLRSSNDTAYISIPKSEVLTQQMGSAGATGFMITATWTFTELKNIDHVNFNFTFGDHATPGVYSRSSFEIK